LPSDCLSCDSSNINYKYLWTLTKTCYAYCPDGSSLTNPSETVCVACHSSCKTCSGGAEINRCESCNIDGPTPYYFPNERICVSICPPYTFVSDQMNKICSRCHEECLTCSGPIRTECLSCNSSRTDYKFYWGFSKTCTSNCPEESYVSDPLQAVCLGCHPTSKTCSGGSGEGFCDSCDTSGATPFYFTSNRTCLVICPLASFISDVSNKICIKCNDECLECSGGSRTDCESCDTQNLKLKYYWPQTKTCTASCPEGRIFIKPHRYYLPKL
jgi:proprotein convertase subtilisin/kexin type 5